MIIGDEPQAGFYATRLVRGGPFVGVRIWKEPAGWMVEIDGRLGRDVMHVWPDCARFPISEGEFRFLRKRPPEINARRVVDLRTIPPVKP